MTKQTQTQTQTQSLDPAELMRQAAKGNLAKEPNKVEPETPQPTQSQPAQPPLQQVGKTYRLLSYPMTIVYNNQRHVFLDGIVRPFSKAFADEMDKLVAIGAATVITEEEAARLAKVAVNQSRKQI